MNAPETLPAPQQDDAGAWVISRYEDVVSVLNDGRFIVPPLGDGDWEIGTFHWFRAQVARFANGPVHDRRRTLCQADLARMDVDALRHEAHQRTIQTIDAETRPSVDIMATVARSVPVGVLALNLGIAEADLETAVEAVTEIAKVYLQSGDAPTPQADSAVGAILRLLPDDQSEAIANRIGPLVQACEATAGLIGNALGLWLNHAPEGTETPSVAAHLTETMRFDPPVLAMRRAVTAPVEVGGVRIPAGTTAVLDIAAANRDSEMFSQPEEFDPDRQVGRHLGFGAGIRPCPGSDHALALAAGVVTAVMECCSASEAEIIYGEPSTLRIPTRLVVTLR